MADDISRPNITFEFPLSSTEFSDSAYWQSISASNKAKQCCDKASDGTAREVQCSNRDDEAIFCRAIYIAKIVALGLLAGAALV